MLQALLILYASTAFINIALMSFLHFKHDRHGYYLKAVLIWTGLFTGFFMDGVVSEKLGLPNDLFGIIFLSMTTFGFVVLSKDIYSLKLFNIRPYILFLAACWVCGVIAHFALNLSFVVSSSFVILGITAPTFSLLNKIRKKRIPLNIIDKLFLALIAAESIHLLDYPFIRQEEWAPIPGFSLGMLFILICSILTPIVINQKINSDLNFNLLKAKENAEVANKAKSLFLANISHELRTPMHGVLSFANICRAKLKTATPEELDDYLLEIHDSGSRLMNLLNDLLDLAKLEAGKMTYDIKENDIQDLLQSVCLSLSALSKSRQIQLKSECQEDLSAAFDSARITQVFNNLISNAIKFSKENTIVNVSARRFGDYIQFCVENQGVGIDPSELESIFDKFTQSSKTRTKTGGTGLGLSICREIVLAHQGSIWAESDPNGMTRFFFEIPADLSTENLTAA